MEKAKQAVSDFVSKDGQHNTVVDRDHRKAVTEEHIFPHRHEEVTTAVDREVHQDHHRTVIQPIKASEKLPERHVHQAAPVEHKTFEHDNLENARTLQERDISKYKDSSVTHDTTQTMSKGPDAGSEHVHHHLHEHIQPIIQKETVNPEIVHTTRPIHEVHHAATVDHGTTTLPAKTWEEFKSGQGILEGRGTSTLTEYEGCAEDFVAGTHVKNAGEVHGATRAPQVPQGGIRAGVRDTEKEQMPQGGGIRSGVRDMSLAEKQAQDSTMKSAMKKNEGVSSKPSDASHNRESASAKAQADAMSGNYKMSSTAATRAYNEASTPRTGAGVAAGAAGTAGAAGMGAGSTLRDTPTTASAGSGGSKASLKDKLNPFKDSDGDGKKGVLS